MNITDLNTIEMNQALAYVLGLIYPLYKEKKICEKEYILGSINHNHNMITSEELAEHFLSVKQLIDIYMKETKPEIKSNSSSEFNISSKEGFTILIDKTDIDSQNSIEILNSLANKIKESNDEIKKMFVRGCFDGRASFDTTSKYLSIDVDRDYEKQDLIKEIIESLNIDINLNRRERNHKKNDQIRIKKDSLEKFLKDIDMFSIRRKTTIENYIKESSGDVYEN